MSDDKQNRRPAAFILPTTENGAGSPAASTRSGLPATPAATGPGRKPAILTDIRETPEQEDLFLADNINPEPTRDRPRPQRFSFFRLAAAALGLLLSLAFGLWTDSLIRSLFSRADWLGYTALALVALFLLALFAAVLREVIGLRALDEARHLKAEAEAIRARRDAKAARTLVGRLETLLATRPETARGRATLAAAKDDIIDAPERLALAEQVLLGPLDQRARQLVLASARRVSVVTAVSPRALVDLAYVLYESARLIRAIAELYGHRPSRFGMIGLFRRVLSHLAVTGTIAVGDSLVQQVLGHGIASRLSARLGEGVVNGLMTVRIGIAAMDYCRPLGFHSLKRPGVGDFLGDLSPTSTRPRDGA